MNRNLSKWHKGGVDVALNCYCYFVESVLLWKYETERDPGIIDDGEF